MVSLSEDSKSAVKGGSPVASQHVISLKKSHYSQVTREPSQLGKEYVSN